MKGLWRAETGAVSIYLILIIVPIFLFQAVLIDFARIKLAEKESESAVKAGVRSSLSAFDKELQMMGLYGLGVPTEDALTIFNKVFENNLSGSVSSSALHFVDTVPLEDEARLTPVYSLASHPVFEQQILEDMKIKAPIEFALEITDKFKKSGVSAPFKAGATFSKEAEALEKLLEQRDEQLDQAWDNTQDLHKKTTVYHTTFQGRIQELSSLSEQIGIHSIEEVQSSLINIKDQITSIQASIRQLDGSIAALAQAGEGAIAGIQSILESRQALQNDVNNLLSKQSELEQLLDLLIKYAALLAKTKLEVEADNQIIASYQQQIEPYLLNAKQINDQIRTELQRITGTADSTSPIFEAFKSVKVLDDDYFHGYSASVSSVIALFQGFRGTISSILLYTIANTNRANEANDAYDTTSNEFYTKQGKLEAERKSNRDRIRTSKNEQKNKIQAILDQAQQAMGTCSDGDVDLYNKLQNPGTSSEKGLYQKYMDINGQNGEIGNGIAYDLEQSDKVATKSMSLLETFSNIAEGARNELYINEFALTKFNYRTYGIEKDINGQPKTAHELIDPATHSLANQEAEYLLYGFSSCKANLSSAYAEMFSFRLAIRTLEAFMDPKKELLNIGSPFLVLLAAAAEGAVKAYSDMNELVKGNQVELSAKLGSKLLTLTYKDYLRLFLLMHSNNTKLMARIQALIELNTSKDLLTATTYVQGYATSTVRLWFIPGIMKLFSGSDLLGCKVNGNRCEITSTAALSY